MTIFSRVSAKVFFDFDFFFARKREFCVCVFFVFFGGVFVLFGGVFCFSRVSAIFVLFFCGVARFFFRAEPSKAGNLRSVCSSGRSRAKGPSGARMTRDSRRQTRVLAHIRSRGGGTQPSAHDFRLASHEGPGAVSDCCQHAARCQCVANGWIRGVNGGEGGRLPPEDGPVVPISQFVDRRLIAKEEAKNTRGRAKRCGARDEGKERTGEWACEPYDDVMGDLIFNVAEIWSRVMP